MCKKHNPMKRQSIIAFAASILGTSLLASLAYSQKLTPDQIFSIDRGHSYIGFNVKYMGYAKVRGRFTQFNGTVIYNENDISKTSVSLEINTESIDTDLDFRDNDLRSENWLDAEKFPKIKFISQRTEKN